MAQVADVDELTDLGALPGNNSSAVFEVNGNGVGVGMSETATTDPYNGSPSDKGRHVQERASDQPGAWGLPAE